MAEGRLASYYGELKKFIENSNYQKVIKVANKILAEEPKELKAWQCKIVALINLDQFSDALSVAKKSKFSDELAFEKAYCEYRLNQVSAAYDTICKAAQVTTRVQELQAQILYRLERYNECSDLYRHIVHITTDDFDAERVTNLTAVAVNCAIDGTSDDDNIDVDESSYELLYNGACHLLAAGRVDEALTKLQDAEALCRTYLTQEEGATEEEVNDDVAIIRVQQGHCMQLLGREREALAVYNNVLKSKPEDPALLAIINNNLVSINRAANVFDSRKRMKTAMAPGLEHKLTSYQRSTISLNHCLLAYHTNQDEVCRTETQNLTKEYPQLSLKAQMIQAAQLGREGKLAEARAILRKCAQDNPDDALYITLAATQILLAKGDKKSACEMLMSLDESDKYRQGIISALVALYVSLGDRGSASAVLRQAVEWHKKNRTSAVHLGELWRHAADFHLRSGDAPTAAASLLELRKLHPKDVNTLAQLISAYARYDLSAAKTLARELPPISGIVGNVDVDTLEASLGHRYFKKIQQSRGEGSPSSPASPKSATTPGTEIKKTKKKKKRKPHLPKDYNPNVLPDPERWLPKWQRKGYRKKKDRRAKDVMKGTQGVSSEAADKFDITKTAGQHKPAQAVVSPQPESQGPRRNILKKKSGGKKKKGSAW
ncbi:signal recognition particle subunit SRP72 [Procambarus clarkii]|uniref:signal recognition particle subunit SRP72 n=1 Tax=Procambarus clarkii TaxID=6728 RepID=UPI001E677DB7|nr:signal recognition particle subunit SRP72-like [Procambarus clarkii]